MPSKSKSRTSTLGKEKCQGKRRGRKALENLEEWAFIDDFMNEGESQVLPTVPDVLQGVGEEVKVQPKKSQTQRELRRKARGTKREGIQTNLETKDGVMKTRRNNQIAQNKSNTSIPDSQQSYTKEEKETSIEDKMGHRVKNNHGKSSKALGSSANNGKSLGIVKRGPVLEKSRGSKITRVAGQRETVLNILTEVKPESEGRNELERLRKKSWIEAMKAQTVKTPTAVARVDGTVRVKGRSGGLVDFLPPLPDEADLFVPPLTNKKFEQWCTEALQLLDTLEEGQSLTLKWMALHLEGCDERKLLLICEVLEALGLMRRTSSDILEWLGRKRLDRQLVLLHEKAQEEDLLQQIRTSCEGKVAVGEEKKRLAMLNINNFHLARKLAMIFLVIPEPYTLTLEVALRVIYAGFKQPVLANTSLAEIAAVLVALGLLRLVQVQWRYISNMTFRLTRQFVNGLH